MARPAPSKQLRSDLRSAQEVAAMRAEQDHWDNEGGQMCAVGRVVLTPADDKPYKVILTDDEGRLLERAFGTMREAEAFVLRNTPADLVRSTCFERPADEFLPNTVSE